MKSSHNHQDRRALTTRTSPLLSDDGKLFLAGDLTASAYLENARRAAIEQTRREIYPHRRRAAKTSMITAIATFALLWAGAAVSLIIGGTPHALLALAAGGLSATLGLLAQARIHRGP
jgi:fatty acid desaturase